MLELDKKINTAPPAQIKPMLFNDLLTEYEELYLKKLLSYKVEKDRMVKIKEYFKGKMMDKISIVDIERYLKHESDKKKLNNITINHFRKRLSNIFNYAIRRKLITENPTTGITKLRESIRLEIILTPEQEVELLKHCSPHARQVIVFAINTGCRREEVLGLKWTQVNFDQRIISLYKTKNGKPRYIPMNTIVYDLLVDIKKTVPLTGPGSEYVYNNKRIETIHTTFNAARKKIGLDKLRFHDLRHCFATRLSILGVPIIQIQNLLGHSNLSQTMKYAHFSSQVNKDAVALLEKLQIPLSNSGADTTKINSNNSNSSSPDRTNDPLPDISNSSIIPCYPAVDRRKPREYNYII